MLRLCWQYLRQSGIEGPPLGPCWARLCPSWAYLGPMLGLCWPMLPPAACHLWQQAAPKHKLYVCLASKGQAVCSCDASETAKHQLISCPKASRTEKPQNHTKKAPKVLCDASDKAKHHLISCPQKSKKGNRKCLTSFLKNY